ncbi:MAG: hypothetical protein ABW215_00605 [Kibdelosporangium sp.]
MDEIDYSDPEVRRILAQYEDVTAQFQHAAAEIELEYQDRAREIEQNAAAQQEANREFYEQLAKAQQVPEAAAVASPWTAPRERETVMSFGEFEDDERPASTWTTPTQPMGFLPPPPIPQPEPLPEPVRPAAVPPTMSFGEIEDDEPVREKPAPQPPKPVSGRRRRHDEDDEDSGRSWLS